jgi:hypothetical protein
MNETKRVKRSRYELNVQVLAMTTRTTVDQRTLCVRSLTVQFILFMYMNKIKRIKCSCHATDKMFETSKMFMLRIKYSSAGDDDEDDDTSSGSTSSLRTEFIMSVR